MNSAPELSMGPADKTQEVSQLNRLAEADALKRRKRRKQHQKKNRDKDAAVEVQVSEAELEDEVVEDQQPESDDSTTDEDGHIDLLA